MKSLINNRIIFALAFLGVLYSCETTELDIAQNPNALTPNQADVNFLFNNIQEDFARHIEGGGTAGTGLSAIGRELVRTENFAGRAYASSLNPASSNGEWSNVYANILADIESLEPLAEEAGLTRHLGIVQFMEAYLMTSLADYFGDIPLRAPFGTAIDGSNGNISPELSPGADAYDMAFTLLDQADINFTNESLADPTFDFFYNNNFDQWQLATNTLRMKLLVQRRLVDPNAMAAFNAIVASGNYIQSGADDMIFEWPASSAANPDVRHPKFPISYTVSGANEYQSNWLMEQLRLSPITGDAALEDPRRRYYVYRQNAATPGSSTAAPSLETLDCSVEQPPQHYIDGGFTFCFLEDGYWGRDHGNQDGIPPDSFLRSIFGVYPAGGRFDDDAFTGGTPTGPGAGGAGAGITTVLSAELALLLQAEMAMVAGNEPMAGTLLGQAITTSVGTVMAFGSTDAGADLSFAPTAAQVTGFVTAITAAFTEADTARRWDILGEQFLISTFNNGIEGYNFYRRTGFPTTVQANIEPDPGLFIRSLFYAENSVNNNPSISQKASNTEPVFWDTNPTGPIAN